MSSLWMILSVVAGAAVGLGVGWLIERRFARRKRSEAEEEAKRLIAEAQKEAETLKKEKLLEAKEEWFRLKQNFEAEVKAKRAELQKLQRQLAQQEINIDRRADLLTGKEKELESLERELQAKAHELQQRETELSRLVEEENRRLEQISGLTKEEAKRIQMENLLESAREEAALMVKEIRDRARQTASRESKEIILQAIERSAAYHAVESNVSVVNLPNDEMKGRIIGREGRNIRAFEMATGVDVLVDDTPETVFLSGFDPIRREIAKTALERLIADGRIHPGRIEEVLEKVRKEMDERIVETGEQALLETGVHGVHPELVRHLGKLKYCTSAGQNVLQHSIEVATLSGLMAAQLELDAAMATRAGLLHDIGRAVDKYMEGTSFAAGLELVKKYGEGPIVQNTLSAFEGDHVPLISPIPALVRAADAISVSRPGARREMLETFFKRMQRLEQLASSFDGVSRCYAIQAGREIRVMVQHDKIDDLRAEQLASEIAKRIQEEMEYPGQIKVSVIREYRTVSYAR